MTRFKKTNKFPKFNPYLEGTSAWHCWIDIETALDRQDEEFSYLKLSKYHGIDADWYILPLNQLIRDGYVKVIKNEKRV